MSKRGIAMAAAVLTVGLLAGIAPAQAKSRAKTTTTTVRGGYVNDVACVPRSAGTTDDPDVVALECDGSSLWNGDFTGRTVIHLVATLDTAGRMAGTYEEMFVGAYSGDHSHGALHTKGTFSIDENMQFTARATITSGTCDWAGSSGRMAYDGFSENGGYVGQWKRPVVRPPSDPTCNPIDYVPGT